MFVIIWAYLSINCSTVFKLLIYLPAFISVPFIVDLCSSASSSISLFLPVWACSSDMSNMIQWWMCQGLFCLFFHLCLAAEEPVGYVKRSPFLLEIQPIAVVSLSKTMSSCPSSGCTAVVPQWSLTFDLGCQEEFLYRFSLCRMNRSSIRCNNVQWHNRNEMR